MTRSRAVVAAAAVALGGALAGCSSGGGTPGPTSTPGVGVKCPWEKAAPGCATVAVTFPLPQTLPQIQAAANANAGAVIALWRTAGVCLPQVAFGAPPATEVRRSDPFAYWHAGDLVARQAAKGPPATDGGYTFRLRDLWVQEWQAVDQIATTFSAAVFLLPRGTVLPGRMQPVASHRSQGSDALYIDNHDAALAPILPPPTPAPGC